LPREWNFSSGGGLIYGVWIFGGREGIGGALFELPLLRVSPKGRIVRIHFGRVWDADA